MSGNFGVKETYLESRVQKLDGTPKGAQTGWGEFQKGGSTPTLFLLSFEMSFLGNLNLEQKAGNNLNLMNLDVIRGAKSNVEDYLEAKED